MFNYLKKKSIKKQMDKNLNKRDLSEMNTSLKTLGFLFDEEAFRDSEELYDYCKNLGLKSKDIKLFSFVEFKKKAPTLLQDQINEKDFLWNGKITNISAKEFLNTSFDVLVGYYKGNHGFLDFMVSESKAKFKVGGMDADARLFDLLIDINNIEIFKTEFKKYLFALNKI